MKKIILITSALFSALFLNAQKSNIEFEEYDLDNGLHVILHEDHTTPIVAVSVLYNVGSKNETKGKTGYAHFFEHLMFEESKNIGTDQYAKIVQSVGGTLNANTSNDRTYYHAVLPSNQLELGLWLESERMLNAVISPKGVENQKEVVKEEKRTRDNQPYSSIPDETFKRMFKGTPYAWIPIGSFEDLTKASVGDFQDFYNTYYVPNNATLSIAGDIDIEEAKAFINKYFSTIPKGKQEIIRPTISQALLTKEIVDTVYDNIQLPLLLYAYKTAPQGTKDAYVLDMISKLLSGGKSARLHKELVEQKQLAIQASGVPLPLSESGVFGFVALPNVGKKMTDLEKGVDKVIEELKTGEISDREFEKLKNQEEAEFIQSNSRMAGISESLANYHVYYGDANLINTELEKYSQITKEDLKEVANKYLVPSNRVKLYYLPKK